MNREEVSVTIDYLVYQNNGNTLYFEPEFCPIFILREILLRGLQISQISDSMCILDCGYDYYEIMGCGNGFGIGEGEGIQEPLWGLEMGSGISCGYSTGSGWNGSVFDRTGPTHKEFMPAMGIYSELKKGDTYYIK